MTLLEVVAAIALVSTLLVAALLALGRHSRQVAAAQRKQTAVEFADAWLSSWRERENDARDWSQKQEGDAAEGMIWRFGLQSAAPQQVGDLRLGVARLEVLRKDAPTATPLTSVEMLVILNDPP